MTIPLPVLEYAKIDSLDPLKLVPANPISWHEDQEQWVIVYEDGRKIVHLKEQKPAVHNVKQPTKHRRNDKT